MGLNLFQAMHKNSLFVQGRWDTNLVQTALSRALVTKKTRHWIEYLDIGLSIEGISLNDWHLVADHFATSRLRSPKLLFKLANAILAPGLVQELTQNDKHTCIELLQRLPRTRILQGVSDSLLSGYLGTRLAHYPCLIDTPIVCQPATLFFHKQSENYRNHANRLTSLSTPFYSLIAKTLEKAKSNNTTQRPRVSVVGNSPDILKQNKGSEIDAADIVIRFNHVTQDPKNHQYIGNRTDLWVMSPSTPTKYCPEDATGVIITGLHALQRPSFYWRTLPELDRTLSQLPARTWYELVNHFHAPPSAGTLVLASLRAMPLDMEVRCYGFTTHHKNLTQRPNHHADNTPRSTRHNWQAETHWLTEYFS